MTQIRKYSLNNAMINEQKTKREMLMYKHELINREENFNRRFGSSIDSHVGTLNPLSSQVKSKVPFKLMNPHTRPIRKTENKRCSSQSSPFPQL